MQISFTDRCDCITESLKSSTERRLLFALSRFDSKIVSVNCEIHDKLGPHGGDAKHVRVTVHLLCGQEVEVVEQDPDIQRCLARAAGRAGRTVGRAITGRLDGKLNGRPLLAGPF